MYRVVKDQEWERYNGPLSYKPSPDSTTFCEDAEPLNLPGFDRPMPRLYRVFRRPRGMLGCWVVFKWNGDEHVPDLSIPIAVHRLPRDAQPLSDAEMIDYWKRP